jgi:NAD(P)-dependent dehydrogenase (short-subunit alcohol dehydrogenase family)
MDVIQDEDLVGQLSDKVMLVTGVSSGIGIETLRALHATGATVYGTVRNLLKGQRVVDEILAAEPSNKAKIELLEIDLESFDSIKKGVAEFLKKESKLNILVNNAGVSGFAHSDELHTDDNQRSWPCLKEGPRMDGKHNSAPTISVTFSCSSSSRTPCWLPLP